MEKKYILVINPGSMTTRVSVFEGEKEVIDEELTHDNALIDKCGTIAEQLPLRRSAVEDFIIRHNLQGTIAALACRGAPLKPVEAGTYIVEEPLFDELVKGNVATPHVSMLAIMIGWEIAQKENVNAYFTDPVSVDEFNDISRITGRPEIERKSLWHALNCRAVVRRGAKELGMLPKEINAVAAHMGSGITVACFEKGRCVDACNANSESPFSPERSGTLPFQELVELCYSGKYTKAELLKVLMKKSGLTAHLGTNSGLEVQERIEKGDKHAEFIYNAMIYNIAKTIGSFAPVLNGKIDAVILTGALARSDYIVPRLTRMISFLGRVLVYPGQDEMAALAYGAFQVLEGKIQAKIYKV